MLVPTAETNSRSYRSSLRGRAQSLGIILREEFGVPFVMLDGANGEAIQDGEADVKLPSMPAEQGSARGKAQVTLQLNGTYQLVLPLSFSDGMRLLGVGTLTGFSRTPAETEQELARMQKWAQSTCDRIAMTNAVPVQHRKGMEQDSLGTLAWEAISSLEQLTRRLRVHKETEKHQVRILQAAAGLIRVQSVIWVPHQASNILTAGDFCLAPADCRQLVHRLTRSQEIEKIGYHLLNEVRDSSMGPFFPQINNLLALSIRDHGTEGFLLAINKRQSAPGTSPLGDRSAKATAQLTPAPFRRSDVVVLAPFAALFSLHASASARYHDLKELLVGLARSLTSAIDAKDAYTFGHSERVGRVAVELGRELGLQADEVSDLYLAGLLHDIGKIGIRDGVLAKREPLTTEEMDHLKQHVTIGHAILADLRPIHHLLPGVLYHHERYDGKGYPDGLKGEEIPLIARILAVADGYDAMSSTRPYRVALARERVETILKEGAGSQWDKQVVEAFFRCRDKVYTVRQRGIGESLRQAISGALREKHQVDGSILAE